MQFSPTKSSWISTCASLLSTYLEGRRSSPGNQYYSSSGVQWLALKMQLDCVQIYYGGKPRHGDSILVKNLVWYVWPHKYEKCNWRNEPAVAMARWEIKLAASMTRWQNASKTWWQLNWLVPWQGDKLICLPAFKNLPRSHWPVYLPVCLSFSVWKATPQSSKSCWHLLDWSVAPS